VSIFSRVITHSFQKTIWFVIGSFQLEGDTERFHLSYKDGVMLSADNDKEAESEAESSGEGELGTDHYFTSRLKPIIISDLNGLLSFSVVFHTVLLSLSCVRVTWCHLVIHEHDINFGLL